MQTARYRGEWLTNCPAACPAGEADGALRGSMSLRPERPHPVAPFSLPVEQLKQKHKSGRSLNCHGRH